MASGAVPEFDGNRDVEEVSARGPSGAHRPMKKSRFTEEQIACALYLAETRHRRGRRLDVSDAKFKELQYVAPAAAVESSDVMIGVLHLPHDKQRSHPSNRPRLVNVSTSSHVGAHTWPSRRVLKETHGIHLPERP